MRKFISYQESISKLKNIFLPDLGFEKIPLQNSLDRVLFEDIIAKSNSPEFPTSALDGFAISAKDQQFEFIEIEEFDNPAGNLNQIPTLKPRKAIKTFTGSVMPKNSDTLIPIENVEVVGNKLYIKERVSIGFGVRPVGEIYKKNDVIISKNSKIGYAEIGVMASLNIVSPKVFVKPKVAILSTGSELLEIGEERTSSTQILSSNNYTLESLIIQNGAIPIQLGTVSDDRKKILKSLNNAILSKAEIIVTTGGVSVGDYDFIDEVIKKLDFEIIFHGVKIKPGQHILIATHKKTSQILIALPGFAYSSTVTAILYVLPLIRKMLGLNFENEIIEAFLAEKFYKKSKKTEFTAGNLYLKDGKNFFDFKGKIVGTSAILTNMLNFANLLMTSETDGDLEKGTKVNILKIC